MDVAEIPRHWFQLRNEMSRTSRDALPVAYFYCSRKRSWYFFFCKTPKRLLNFNKSWQQAGFIGNSSVICHLEMVSQVVKRTAVSINFMECKKGCWFSGRRKQSWKFVQHTLEDVTHTFKKLILNWKISLFF